MFSLLTSLAFFVVFRNYNAKNIILTPTNTDAQSSAIGLIYVHGANIDNSEYIPMLEEVQEQTSQPLYVGLPDFHVGLPSLKEFVILLPSLIKEMEAQGLPSNATIFFGGHSLGGAIVNDFTGTYQYTYREIYEFDYGGQILCAAFITHKYRDQDTQEINIKVPSLTVGGELDGNLYVSRIIEQYYVQLMLGSSSMGNNIDGISKTNHFNDNKTLLNFPVILVDGMSHMQWATNDSIPENVWKHDLVPEISYDDAHNIQSKILGCWINLVLDNTYNVNYCNYNYIYNQIMNSYELAEPMINALKLEGFYWFKRPCNCDPLTCHSTNSCNGGSIWGNYIPQQMMCGFEHDNDVTILVNNTDSFHPTYQVNPIHYANIWSNCNKTYFDSKYLNTSTVSQNKYCIQSIPDTGGHPSSAYEIRHKMKSRQSCYECIFDDDYIEEEDYEICGKINQVSLNWALQNAPKQTLKRYQEYGLELRVGDDLQTGGGPAWTFPHLKFNQTCDNKNNRYFMNVRSQYLWVKTLSAGCKFVADECGVHYCKILSPAYALEFLYTDSLRFNLSLSKSNETIDLNC